MSVPEGEIELVKSTRTRVTEHLTQVLTGYPQYASHVRDLEGAVDYILEHPAATHQNLGNVERILFGIPNVIHDFDVDEQLDVELFFALEKSRNDVIFNITLEECGKHFDNICFQIMKQAFSKNDDFPEDSILNMDNLRAWFANQLTSGNSSFANKKINKYIVKTFGKNTDQEEGQESEKDESESEEESEEDDDDNEEDDDEEEEENSDEYTDTDEDDD